MRLNRFACALAVASLGCSDLPQDVGTTSTSDLSAKDRVLEPEYDGDRLRRVSLTKYGAYQPYNTGQVIQGQEVPAPSEVTRHNAGQGPAMGVINLELNDGVIQPVLCDTMSFEADAYGNPILAGADLTSAYTPAGITIDTFDRTATQVGTAIAFDSSNPTGGDLDLGTPNQSFGGPGIGNGGASNDTALGNLMIRAENTVDTDGDGLVDDPDDHANGACFRFSFAEDKCVSRADLVDVETAEVPTIFTMLDGNNDYISEVQAGGMGDNSVEHVAIGVCNVRTLEILLQSSGAVHDVAVCNAPEPPTSLFIDMDLLNVRDIEFDLRLTASDGTTVHEISSSRQALSPGRAVAGGNLLPFPLAAGSVIPTGTWTSFGVEIDNLVALYEDGTTAAIPGNMNSSVAQSVDILDCGSTTVSADWAINARIEGDLLGMGIGFDFSNVTVTQDTTGC